MRTFAIHNARKICTTQKHGRFHYFSSAESRLHIFNGIFGTSAGARSFSTLSLFFTCLFCTTSLLRKFSRFLLLENEESVYSATTTKMCVFILYYYCLFINGKLISLLSNVSHLEMSFPEPSWNMYISVWNLVKVIWSLFFFPFVNHKYISSLLRINSWWKYILQELKDFDEFHKCIFFFSAKITK